LAIEPWVNVGAIFAQKHATTYVAIQIRKNVISKKKLGHCDLSKNKGTLVQDHTP
jgi:hypothetical protein